MLAATTGLAQIDPPEPRTPQGVHSLWRGKLGPDSVFVLARYWATRGAATCMETYGYEIEDSSLVVPRYFAIQIETARGRILFSDSTVSSEHFCTDRLSAAGVPWHSGLAIRFGAEGWGCEPANNCGDGRLVYLPARGEPITSTWECMASYADLDRPFEGSYSDGYFEYAMPMVTRMWGRTIEFDPALPPGTKVGSLLGEFDVSEEFVSYVHDPARGRDTLFAHASGTAPTAEPFVVGPDDRFEVMSAMLRVDRLANDRHGPRLSLARVGLERDGRRIFATLAALSAAGFTIRR